MIEIIVNKKSYSYDNTSKLKQVLEDLNLYTQPGIAVAVNNEVIPKEEWANHLLKDKDQVLIITATQGG